MGRHYKKPNFRTVMSGNVTEEDGRVYLYGSEEVGPVQLESRFHFFKSELSPDAWERVRKRHKLSKKVRHTCYSHGVRKGEGRGVGPWVSPTFQIQWAYPPENF
jgi:hypothetical protein